MGTLAPGPVARHDWWFHQSPAVLVSSWKGKAGQPNEIKDAVQLELDCLLRTEQLLAAHDAMRHLGCDPKVTTEDISADRLAAFMIHQALVSDPTADSRSIVRLETDLFLLRTRHADQVQQMQLFALFGKKCVPMQQALQRAGTWDEQLQQPNSEITGAIAAVLRLRPADHKQDWWQHFCATRFENATPLLATRKVLLRAGIAYFHADDMPAILKHLCAGSLQRYMSQMQHVLFDPDNEQFAHITRVSGQILARLTAPDASPARAVSAALAEALRLYAIVDTMLLNAPLCIRALLAKLEHSRGKDASHGLKDPERFVLRTFLKTCGAERQVTLELFGKLSGLDDRSFHIKYGRDIHGSYNKQSHCCGCAFIQDKGLCPYQDKTRAKQVLKITSPNDTQVVDIEECFRGKPSTPSAFCTAFYRRRHGTPKRVYNQVYANPRSYFLDAHAAKRARVEQPAPPAASSFPCTAARRARIQRVAQGLLPGR